VRLAPLHITPAAAPARSHSPLLLGIAVTALLAAAITGTLLYTSKNNAVVQQAPVEATAAPSAKNTAVNTKSDVPNMVLAPDEIEPAQSAPAASPAIQTAPATAAPVAASAPIQTGPKRNDIAFVLGHWCQPYNGLTIHYEVISTGKDTVLTRINHPQAAPWDVASRVVATGNGFDFLPLDPAADQSDRFHFDIIDDKMLKLTSLKGEAEDGSILRIRCAAE